MIDFFNRQIRFSVDLSFPEALDLLGRIVQVGSSIGAAIIKRSNTALILKNQEQKALLLKNLGHLLFSCFQLSIRISLLIGLYVVARTTAKRIAIIYPKLNKAIKETKDLINK